MANPYFNAEYYLAKNPDVFAAGINTPEAAWEHYVNFGAAEALNGAASRSPAPWFDIAYYLAENPDLNTAGLTAGQLFGHFTEYGLAEGRSPSLAAEGVDAESLAAYAAANEDLRTAFGIKEGEEPTEAQLIQLAQHFYLFGYKENRDGLPADFSGDTPGQTFTLTVNPDVATANVFDAPRGWTPGGTDQMNTLNDDDVLTGTGDNPTLNVEFVDVGDAGDQETITPELRGIETINVNALGTRNKTLDLQDASGVDSLNVSRINSAAFTFANIADAVGSMSVNNTQANAHVRFNFLNSALSGAEDEAEVTLNNVDIGTLRIQAPGEGYETLTMNSVGSDNEVDLLEAEDLETLIIAGDQDLTLGGETVVRRADGAVEAVRAQAALENVAGSLSKIDASEFEGDLQITLGAEIDAGQDGTSGKAVEFEFIGGKGDDTIVLASTVVGGAVGNTDKIDGGEGENTLIVTGGTTINAGGTAAAPVANVTNIQALAILSGHDVGDAGDIININADAFDSLSSIYVRNEGQDFGQFNAVGAWVPGNPAAPAAGDAWVSRPEVATVNLNNLTAEQAQAITLAHGTTGNSDIQNNNLNVNLKVATGAADAAQVTIVDGVNTDPVFNARIAAAAVERVTLVDSDTESNTIHLNQGAFTQAGSSITVKGGAAGQYMSLDSFNGQSGAAGIVNALTGNGYGYATDGTTGNNTSATAAANRDAAVSTVFYGTVGAAADNVTRHVVENVDASEYAGDFVIRVGEVTRADGTTSMNIQTGVGNDTVIFDAIGSTSAGFTSGDTVAMGAGTDTLVIDGNTTTIAGTPRIDHQTSEWDNLSGIDVLRFGNNAGVANGGGVVANAGGAYYARIDNDFVSQTDAGDRLTIINNDGDLVNNTESDLVLDLRGLSQDKWVTFVGANANGAASVGVISSNRIVVDDISANRNMILNGGDTDVRVNTTAGYVAGNNNVYEVRNTANVSINDLAQTSNFGLIDFTNDQAVAQTLTLTLNNTVIEALVDSSSTATTAATQEILRVVANDNGLIASALNIDARDVSGFHGLNVTGSVNGNDILSLNANVGGTENIIDLDATSTGDRVNWTGGANTAVVTIDMGADGNSGGTLAGDGFATFQVGAVTTTHDVDNVDIVDISGLTYATSTINGVAGSQTIIGGAGVDTINGGAGDDIITGGAGADNLTGGAGKDSFVYTAVAESTGAAAARAYDVIADFNAGGAGIAGQVDVFNVSGIGGNLADGITAVDAAVAAGTLNTATFDADLGAAIGAAQLGADNAVLFTATIGTLTGRTFLIVDANNTAGYQAGADLVIDVTGIVGTLDTTDFI